MNGVFFVAGARYTTDRPIYARSAREPSARTVFYSRRSPACSVERETSDQSLSKSAAWTWHCSDAWQHSVLIVTAGRICRRALLPTGTLVSTQHDPLRDNSVHILHWATRLEKKINCYPLINASSLFLLHTPFCVMLTLPWRHLWTGLK